MKKLLLASSILFNSISITQAAPFANGNVQSGEQLFSQHKCNSCHANKFGGDGNTIFTRPDRKVKSASALSGQIRMCSTNLGLMLFDDDEDNLAAYLNQHFYKFK